MTVHFNPGLDPKQVYRRLNSEELIYGDGRPYIGPEEAVRGAIKWLYEPITAAGFQLIIDRVLQTAPHDQMQAVYNHNPWFRREVDKELVKLMNNQIRFEAKRTAERRRLKRKRRNQK